MSSSIIINANNITDSVTNSVFQVNFERSVNLVDKHISLTSASLFFSWRNITTQNNKFSYTWNDDIEYFVEIPIGLYEISDIRSYFQFVMSQNNHVMTNTETGSTIYFIDFVVSNTNYSIEILTYPTGFTSNISFIGTEKNPRLTLPVGINAIFGYAEDFTTDAGSSIITFSSTIAPNVSPDNSVLIVCDQVLNEFSNLGIIYALFPSVGIGSLIVDKPAYPIHSKLRYGNYNHLTFQILSSKSFRPIELIDPEINFIFSIK